MIKIKIFCSDRQKENILSEDIKTILKSLRKNNKMYFFSVTRNNPRDYAKEIRNDFYSKD